MRFLGCRLVLCAYLCILLFLFASCSSAQEEEPNSNGDLFFEYNFDAHEETKEIEGTEDDCMRIEMDNDDATELTPVVRGRIPSVYVMDFDGMLYALDGEDGKVLWTVRVSDTLVKVSEGLHPRDTSKFELSESTKLFNDLVVSVDGFLIVNPPKANPVVLNYTINHIVNNDYVTMDLLKENNDRETLLFNGEKRLLYMFIDVVNGTLASFMGNGQITSHDSPTGGNEVLLILEYKNVNGFNPRERHFVWTSSMTSVFMQFSTLGLQPSPSSLIHKVDFKNDTVIQGIDQMGFIRWTTHFQTPLYSLYYREESRYVFVPTVRCIDNFDDITGPLGLTLDDMLEPSQIQNRVYLMPIAGRNLVQSTKLHSMLAMGLGTEPMNYLDMYVPSSDSAEFLLPLMQSYSKNVPSDTQTSSSLSLKNTKYPKMITDNHAKSDRTKHTSYDNKLFTTQSPFHMSLQQPLAEILFRNILIKNPNRLNVTELIAVICTVVLIVGSVFYVARALTDSSSSSSKSKSKSSRLHNHQHHRHRYYGGHHISDSQDVTINEVDGVKKKKHRKRKLVEGVTTGEIHEEIAITDSNAQSTAWVIGKYPSVLSSSQPTTTHSGSQRFATGVQPMNPVADMVLLSSVHGGDMSSPAVEDIDHSHKQGTSSGEGIACGENERVSHIRHDSEVEKTMLDRLIVSNNEEDSTQSPTHPSASPALLVSASPTPSYTTPVNIVCPHPAKVESLHVPSVQQSPNVITQSSPPLPDVKKHVVPTHAKKDNPSPYPMQQQQQPPPPVSHSYSTTTQALSPPFTLPRRLSIRGLNKVLPVKQDYYHKDFTETQFIGSGGFGAVFLSKKSFEQVEYAIKKVKIVSNYQRSEKLLRVLNEVNVFAKFDHPNIVRYYDSWLELVPLSQIERELSPNRFQTDIHWMKDSSSESEEILKDKRTFDVLSQLMDDSSDVEDMKPLVNGIAKRKYELGSQLFDNESLVSVAPSDASTSFADTSLTNSMSPKSNCDSLTHHHSSTNDILSQLSDNSSDEYTSEYDEYEYETDDESESESESESDSSVTDSDHSKTVGDDKKPFDKQENTQREVECDVECHDTHSQLQVSEMSDDQSHSLLVNSQDLDSVHFSPFSSAGFTGVPSPLLPGFPLQRNNNNMWKDSWTENSTADHTMGWMRTGKDQVTEPIERSDELKDHSFISDDGDGDGDGDGDSIDGDGDDAEKVKAKHGLVKSKPKRSKPSSKGVNSHTTTTQQEALSNQLEAYLQTNALVLYIQMAYCGDRTLKSYLDNKDRVVSELEIVNIGYQLSSALSHIHSKFVIHRDVKPLNIFYTHNKQVFLIDFGLSRDLTVNNSELLQRHASSQSSDSLSTASQTGGIFERTTSSSTVVSKSTTTTHIGSVLYSSPEQFQDKAEYDYKSDIFSLGIVLYELTFPAFKSDHERYQVLKSPRIPGNTPIHNKNISPSFYSLMCQMMSTDPTIRPSAAEVVHELLFLRSEVESSVSESSKLLTKQINSQPCSVCVQLATDSVFSVQKELFTAAIKDLAFAKTMSQITYSEDEYRVNVMFPSRCPQTEIVEAMRAIREIHFVQSVTSLQSELNSHHLKSNL